MAGYATAWSDGVTVALGTADAPSAPLANRLAAALTGVESIDRIEQYRIGPSVGVHTGPGTFGFVVFPTVELP